MSRCFAACAFLLLLFVVDIHRALAQPAPSPTGEVTIIPLSCRLCETRLSPDGKTAAVFENRDIAGGEVSSPAQIAITLIDTATGRPLGRLSGQTDYAADVAFSPDGRWLAALHANGSLRLWDARSRKLAWERFVGIGAGRLAFTPDGSTIVASRMGIPQSLWFVDRQSGTIQQILTWRFDTLSEFMDVAGDTLGSLGMMFSAWAISPEGDQIAAATVNDDIWLFDVGAGTAEQVLAGEGKAGAFSIRHIGYTPGGEALYFGDSRRHAPRILSLDTMTDTLPAGGGERIDPEQVDLSAYDLYGLTLSPDGQTFAWVDQAPGPDDREQPLIMAAAVDEWPQVQVLAAELPANLRATPNTRVFFTPDGRLIAGGFVALDGENALVVVPQP
jgi:WD40 repeat protein